jgi:hypothetical protein
MNSRPPSKLDVVRLSWGPWLGGDVLVDQGVGCAG